MNVSKNIRIAMAAADVRSLNELSERTCIPYTTLTRRMKQPQTMTLGELGVICNKLNVLPGEILNEKRV